ARVLPAVRGLGIRGGPLALAHGHLRPLLQGGPVLVHVARGDEAEHGRGAPEAVRRLELPGSAVSRRGVTPTPERPDSPWAITATSQRPWWSAATAWPTMMMKEQPPTVVPST